ncbi:MAG: toprim domain-containing protein [Gammaproteobacteria bacterium]|nr:toprim domain-containing protein [Gammaproteobacteria bacterium]
MEIETQVRHEPCPECRAAGNDNSGDNLAVYPEGRGAHCFACGHHVHGDEQPGKEKHSEKLTRPIQGKVRPLKHRQIDQRTARLYDYRLAKVNGEVVEVSNYYVEGEVVAQHVRGNGKTFRWKGDTSDLPMFGQWLWGGKGKRIIVTEGEIDCMSISMLQQNRWPVVSLPNGVSHAPKAMRTNLEFLSGYDEIVLCFDNDDAGRTAAEKCADILPAGKVHIARTPRKDANDHILNNDSQALLTSLYEARTYQPDGILHASDITEGDRPHQRMMLFPWDSLTSALMGQRSGEMTLWASGTGSGKSTVVRELALHHLDSGRRVGLLMLEEAPMETMDDFIGLRLNKAVRQIRAARELNHLLQGEGKAALDFGFPDDLTKEMYDKAKDYFRQSPLYIYDHQGTNEFNNILARVEYMAASLECDVVIIDHLTAFVAGMTERFGNERESIDHIMRRLRSIVERTGCHLDVVSQLNRLQGKSAEEGGQISLNNLRGSGSLGSVPNNVLAIERDQQSDDPSERDIIKVRSLKGRFLGGTGIAGYLKFNLVTRRLEEVDWKEKRDGESGLTFEPNVEEADVLPNEQHPVEGGMEAVIPSIEMG